jgi:hypothetical protein
VRGFPLAGMWHVVHWHDAHLSAPAEAFRRYLLHFAVELRGAPDGAAIGERDRTLSAAPPARRPRARGGPARAASPRRARNP